MGSLADRPDLDAIPELPALVCEGYRDLGVQASLSASAR